MLIEDMVKIYSPTGSEEGIVDFLLHWAASNRFKAHRDEVGNFIAEKGQGREILLVGHVDTVPGEIPVKIKNNILFGRGSVDAKGPLACFLEAAASVDNGRILIIGAIDEEGESEGARHVLDKYNPEYIIVGEPSGFSNLNIGYKGRINLFYENQNTKSHSSSSEQNCCGKAILFHNRLKNFCEEFNKDKSLFEQLNMSMLSMNSNDDGLSETVNMVINFRLPLEFSKLSLKNFIEEIRGEAGIRYSRSEDAVKVSKSNKLVTAFLRAIRSAGGEVKFKLKSGTSDMNLLKSYGVPMVTYGPGDSSLDHTPYEHLDLEEYETAVRILTDVLKDLSSQ